MRMRIFAASVVCARSLCSLLFALPSHHILEPLDFIRCRLPSLCLQCRPEEYTKQLSAALKTAKYLKQLRLEGNGLGDREAAVLAEGIAANTSLQVLDLQKNRIGNDGGSALAKGIAKNSSLIEINLMNQPSRWGDSCLDSFLAMFETNITLLKITWRLESRKSFAINKLITRNNEIDRRKKCGMPYHDLLPSALKGGDVGKENVPAHKHDVSTPPSGAADDGTGPNAMVAPAKDPNAPAVPLQEQHASASSFERESSVNDSKGAPSSYVSSYTPPLSVNSTSHNANTSLPTSAYPPKSPSSLRPASGNVPGTWRSNSAGMQWSGNGAGSAPAEGTPKPGVPRVRRAMPSVLARWPPAAQQES